MSEDNRRLLGNRYLVVRRLGGGATGHVDLAEDTTKANGHNLCAVKELNPNTSDPETHRQFCARFRDEETYLRVLDGFGGQIPKLYECFSEQDEGGEERHYIVQEYVAGKTLRETLKEEGPFKEAKVKEVLMSLLPVIAHIHADGYIHRDINPTNIILRSPDDLPVLIDFGAVKEVLTTFVASSRDAGPQTVVIGKEGYMAPEHLRGRPIPASDLYSLGVTAIELLSGLEPREMEHDFLNGTLSWRSHVPNITPDFAAVLDKAVEQYAGKRYRDAPAMLAALAPVSVPESDEKFRKQLSELLPTMLERRPRALAGGYEKCLECPFYLLPQDKHCLNCGAYNLRRLTADQLHLMKESSEDHLALLHSRGDESWVITLALKYFSFNGTDEDFVPFAVAGVVSGLLVAVGGWWLSGAILYSMGGGVLMAAGILIAGVAAHVHYDMRVREISGNKDDLLDGLKTKTKVFRQSGPYLKLIEREVAGRIADNSKQEARIKNRLLSTESAVGEIVGASELQKDKEDLSRALAQSQRRNKKYQVKQLEIKLLTLHNKLQASARGESLDEETGAAMEKTLADMSKLINQMFGDLKEANILDSDNGRRWVARILRVRDVVAISRRLLTKQMNAFVMRHRNATVALPEEFAHNLDLLNAYVTYEDFHKEYQALQAE
jgi:serine/threonine protein kinase